MRLTRVSFAALGAATAHVLAVAAGPVEKRSDSTSSAISPYPTAALVEIAISSSATAVDFALPATPTTAVSVETAAAQNASFRSNATSAEASLTSSKNFPVCVDASAKPFCLPANNTELYSGEDYFVTWNTNYFGSNSTIDILLNLSNDTSQNVWSSGLISSAIGGISVDMKQNLLQQDTAYNLTIFAQQFTTAAGAPAIVYTGPTIQLKPKPTHGQIPASAKESEKSGLKIGVPVCLGALAVVAVGLFYAMRKQRRISFGSNLGRNRGYGIRKSRRQRLGQGRSKEDDIMLQERELLRSEYTDNPLPEAPSRSSNDSLAYLVPAPVEDEGETFREEMEKQKKNERR